MQIKAQQLGHGRMVRSSYLLGFFLSHTYLRISNHSISFTMEEASDRMCAVDGIISYDRAATTALHTSILAEIDSLSDLDRAAQETKYMHISSEFRAKFFGRPSVFSPHPAVIILSLHVRAEAARRREYPSQGVDYSWAGLPAACNILGPSCCLDRCNKRVSQHAACFP
jgi:hypothetical protein